MQVYMTPELVEIWEALEDPSFRFYMIALKGGPSGEHDFLMEGFGAVDQEEYVTKTEEEEGVLSIYKDYESAESVISGIVAQTKMKKSDFTLIRGNLKEMMTLVPNIQQKMKEKDGHPMRVEVQICDTKGLLLAREIVYSVVAPKH